MSARNDGGPAFPQISELGDIAATSAGMSLRDWFAGKVLQGLLADPTQSAPEAEFAKAAYSMADAMLAARDQTP